MKTQTKQKNLKTQKKMNKVKDIYSETGIFAIFAANFTTDFATLFGDITAANLDGITLHRYGEKFLTPNIEANNAQTVIIDIIMINIDGWKRAKAVLNANYNITTPITETKTKTGGVSRETTNENENLNFDKVFNDTDFVGNEKSTANSEFNATDTYNLTETRTANTSGKITDNVRNEFLLRANLNLQNTVIDSIIKEITLNIY